ncbi:hypothetical protein BS17DRAFT_345403 [Gyrodon lividus]|nr:hypothetical protein BS17DRAFT_345403 [Gyrodon lividus]
MMASGSFKSGAQRQQYGESGGPGSNNYGGYDAPTRPSPNQGYPSRGYPSQQYQQGYGSGGAYSSSYNSAPGSEGQYASPPGPPPHGQGHGAQQTQTHSQYNAPPIPPPSYSGPGSAGGYATGGNNNVPSGGFSTSTSSYREEPYGSEYKATSNDQVQAPRRGEAASYYNAPSESGQANAYAHLAGIAAQHGADTDPEIYHQATQGLHEKIQSQSQSRPLVTSNQGSNDEDGYKSHFDAHKKAYGEDSDSHGPMDTDTIGAAAAMEAFKQTVAQHQSQSQGQGAPSGAAAGRPGAKPTSGDEEDDEDEEAPTRGSGSGGMQDKIMALAMSQAGKLFDKKNSGSGGGDSQGKAQAMQSAAATAMQLFTQYKTTGKIEPSDMQKIMGVAMTLL